MKNYFLILIILLSCSKNNDNEYENIQKKSDFIIENNVFEISYNENIEQPNWIEYTVKDFVKVSDRGNMDFYLEEGIWTSNDADYYNNPCDKGHMAPASSFIYTWSNLEQTFSFVNCALQKDNLNRGELRELEEQVRDWAKDTGPVKVRIELKFSSESIVLSSGATVPDGFYKFFEFNNGSKNVFIF